MGSCISVHKDPESATKLPSPMKSKNEKVLIPSPVKERTDAVNAGDRTVGDVALKPQSPPSRFRHSGSKDEAFFDSQPWLESDCEDDFLSVNGGGFPDDKRNYFLPMKHPRSQKLYFTPSRGNTPVHHSFSWGNTRANAVEQTIGYISEPSFPDKKKRLSELFKESLRNNEYADMEPAADNQNESRAKVVPESTGLTQLPKSTNGAPYLCRTSSERTPNGEEDNKALKSGQCCLPMLISSRSFSERKNRMSPAQKVGWGWSRDVGIGDEKIMTTICSTFFKHWRRVIAGLIRGGSVRLTNTTVIADRQVGDIEQSGYCRCRRLVNAHFSAAIGAKDNWSQFL
ncbi:hypothetical protein OROHE_021738 [Orobanche hederae]